MGTYGTPPATRTDSGSGLLIAPPHRYLYTGIAKASNVTVKCLKTGRPNNRNTFLPRRSEGGKYSIGLPMRLDLARTSVGMRLYEEGTLR